MKSGNLQGTTYTLITTGYAAAISYNKMAVGSCPQTIWNSSRWRQEAIWSSLSVGLEEVQYHCSMV